MYVRRTRLPDHINTGYTEDCPFVAPDESYLVFGRVDPAGTDADLYICFRNPEGLWSEPINMESINSETHELSPNVTKDGKFLFFMSFRTGRSRPFWVSADVIDAYR